MQLPSTVGICVMQSVLQVVLAGYLTRWNNVVSMCDVSRKTVMMLTTIQYGSNGITYFKCYNLFRYTLSWSQREYNDTQHLRNASCCEERTGKCGPIVEVVPTAPQSASCHEKRTGESGTHFHKQLVAVDMAHLFLRLWPNGHWCMQHDIHTTLLKELLSTPVLLSKYFEHTGKSRHEYIHCLGKPTCFVWMWKRAASVNSTPNNY